MVTAKAFIEQARIPLNEAWGYIWGTWGTLWTEKKQAASTREMTVRYGKKWIGKMVTDCSGLLRWALYQLGESIVHHARYQYTQFCGPKGKLINGRREDGQPVLPGTAVFLQGTQDHIHHVGVYIGNDICVEAKGTVYGVVTSHLNHWDHWGELKMVDYSDAAALETGEAGGTQDTPENAAAGTVLRAEVDNPQNWLNVRTGPGKNNPVAFQVHRGSLVDVLDAGEPDWWQIRYGGRIGWAAAEYLKVTEPDQNGAFADQNPGKTEQDEENASANPGQADQEYNRTERLIMLRDQLMENAKKLVEIIEKLDGLIEEELL